MVRLEGNAHPAISLSDSPCSCCNNNNINSYNNIVLVKPKHNNIVLVKSKQNNMNWSFACVCGVPLVGTLIRRFRCLTAVDLVVILIIIKTVIMTSNRTTRIRMG